MKSPTTSLRLLALLTVLAATSVTCKRRGGGSSSSSHHRPSSSEDGDNDAPADVGAPAFLTPLLEAGQFREAQNLSRVEPPMLGDVDSYSGFLTVNKTRGANLYFWFFPAEKGMQDAPVLLWLQGGPGSSAMLGVFLENGPVRLKRGRRLKHRRHSWTRAASVLYVDSPAGTGFSFATDPQQGLTTSSEQVADDLLTALRQFFQLFPQLQANEFFITGESYAGKYAPALAMAIHRANAAAAAVVDDAAAAVPAEQQRGGKINLKGLAVGNPLADPESMLDYSEYLYQIGLVDDAGRRRFKEREDVIRELLQQQRWTDAWRERDALIGKAGASDARGDNSTLFREVTGFRFRFNYLHDADYLSRGYKQFVQTSSVRAMLHVGDLAYHNRSAVADRLRGDVMRSARPWYEALLEHYDVLLYNGQLDVADPYPLMVNFIKRLNWSAADEYKKAPRRLWTVDGELAGYAKTAGRLTEVLVRAAGHMVPADQPKWALDLITKFVTHKPIAG